MKLLKGITLALLFFIVAITNTNEVDAYSSPYDLRTQDFETYNFFSDVWGIQSTGNTLDLGVYETTTTIFIPYDASFRNERDGVISAVYWRDGTTTLQTDALELGDIGTWVAFDIPADADNFTINIVTDYESESADLIDFNDEYNDLFRMYNTVRLVLDYTDEIDITSYDLGYETGKEEYGLLFEEEWKTALQMYEIGIEESEGFGLGWVNTFLSLFGFIFGIELLPGLSIGLIASIPIIFGIIFFVLKIVRG